MLTQTTTNVTFASGAFTTNSTMRFTLTVSKYKSGVLSSSLPVSQTVTTRDENALVPQMKMSKSRVKINPNQDLLLEAVTLYPLNASKTYTYNWTVVGDAVDSSAFMQVEKGVAPLRSRYLKIQANSLSETGNYTFRCEIKAAGATATEQSTFTITLNTKPKSGIIFVTPSNGTESKSLFTIQAVGWEDAEGDYPLTYAMYYRTKQNTPFVRLRSAGPSDTLVTVLPLGDSANEYSLEVALEVKDSYGSAINVTTTVLVLPGGMQEREQALLDMINGTDLRQPADLIKTMGQALSYINASSDVLSASAKAKVSANLIKGERIYKKWSSDG